MTSVGITPNGNRGAGCCYGPDIVHNFLRHNNLKIIIRAHEVRLDGIGFHADGELGIVFCTACVIHLVDIHNTTYIYVCFSLSIL